MDGVAQTCFPADFSRPALRPTADSQWRRLHGAWGARAPLLQMAGHWGHRE